MDFFLAFAKYSHLHLTQIHHSNIIVQNHVTNNIFINYFYLKSLYLFHNLLLQYKLKVNFVQKIFHLHVLNILLLYDLITIFLRKTKI